MPDHKYFMQRCIWLAQKGAGQVSPNPMVGAVLVWDNKIIGEGWHEQYGGPHAEVNCIRSVRPEHRHLISESVLYVSLEPCAHFGKTPPCSELIIRERIPQVVIGCIDTFSKVAGKGIEQLKQAGVKVVTQVEEQACRQLNRRFFTFHEKQRPFVILKWAQSADPFIAPHEGKRVALSGELAQRFTHRLRTTEDSILVGYKTALLDNPQLTARHWPGKSPLRLVLDPQLQLPEQLHLLSDGEATIVFNNRKEATEGAVHFAANIGSGHTPASMLEVLYQKNILSLIVEGGSHTLQQFIDAGLWDEAIVINTPKILSEGLAAPKLQGAASMELLPCGVDMINFYRHE